MEAPANYLLWPTFILLLFASAFFSFSETAVIALDRIKLKSLVQRGNRRAIATGHLKDNPRYFFGIILLGTNVAVVLLSAIGSHYLFSGRNIVAATLIVDVIVLIVAEITPKTLALRSPTRFALMVGPVIQLGCKLFGWLIAAMTYLPARLFNLDVGYALSGGDIITEGQIKTMADVGEEEGAIDEGEGELVSRVIDAGNKTVGELMIPKVDIVFLRRGDRLRDAVKLNMETGLSRYPVYGEDEDDILGFLHTKDIIGIYLDGGIDDRVENHLREITFIPESKPAMDLLHELKATRSHIAMVVDEYGQVDGMVTLEDLLEEVVGEIYDESDRVARQITKLSPDKYILDGSLEIEKLEELLETKITGEYETVAGLVMALLGRIPVKDDRVQFVGWQFKVGQMDKRRIRSIFIKKLTDGNGRG